MTSMFIWYELLTQDVDAKAGFYASLFGWQVSDSGQVGMDYRILTHGGVAVGGLMVLPPGAAQSGMRPSWLGYVSVTSVGESLANILAAGGAECMPAMEVPGVGRFALIADPQGALLYAMTPIGRGPATSFAPGRPGFGGWHELHAKDRASALAFYRQQFGWDAVPAVDGGGMGTYVQFNYGAGPMVGGMMNDAAAPRPYWLYFFNVESLDAACQRLVAGGGEVLMDPYQAPSADWFVRARDPQGARFALLAPGR